MTGADVELTVLMPCLNEARTLATCIGKARRFLDEHGIAGEVLIVDNGSTDDSVRIATENGARVVSHAVKGYGSALRRGIQEARGRFVIMGDADDTYDFSNLGEFVRLLRSGHDLVMGSRLRGNIEKNAMPWLHQYVGTPALTGVMNLFYRAHISDTNCGLRGFRKEAIDGLNLRCRGMEFASEMVIRAAQEGLTIAETPISYAAPAVERTPHLRTFRDGWRHLRFMLMLSPTWLFVYPGLALMLVGGALTSWLWLRPVAILGIPLGLSVALFAGALMFVGLEVALSGIFGLLLYARGGQVQRTNGLTRFLLRVYTLERGLLVGVTILGAGLAMGLATIGLLMKVAAPGTISIPVTRLSIVSVFVALLGVQIISFSFFLSLADLNKTLE
jgi:glycosyltransferase involved in cell wall biosynthesis